nr:YciI family protein [Streptomyces atroolivaceus]
MPDVEEAFLVPTEGWKRAEGVCGTHKGIPEKYVAMNDGNQAKWESFPADAWPEAIARQDAFNKKYRESGELLGAYGLADAVHAQLVRRKDGAPVVTDGPYLETKEYLASFYMLDCESLQRAQEIAADMPFADTDPVELWPVLHDAATDL